MAWYMIDDEHSHYPPSSLDALLLIVLSDWHRVTSHLVLHSHTPANFPNQLFLQLLLLLGAASTITTPGGSPKHTPTALNKHARSHSAMSPSLPD